MVIVTLYMIITFGPSLPMPSQEYGPIPSHKTQDQRPRLAVRLGVFISASAKSRSIVIELYPREFVFCPDRSLRRKGLRIIERRYCHVNPFRTDFVLDKQRRATTRGERA